MDKVMRLHACTYATWRRLQNECLLRLLSGIGRNLHSTRSKRTCFWHWGAMVITELAFGKFVPADIWAIYPVEKNYFLWYWIVYYILLKHWFIAGSFLCFFFFFLLIFQNLVNERVQVWLSRPCEKKYVLIIHKGVIFVCCLSSFHGNGIHMWHHMINESLWLKMMIKPYINIFFKVLIMKIARNLNFCSLFDIPIWINLVYNWSFMINMIFINKIYMHTSILD